MGKQTHKSQSYKLYKSKKLNILLTFATFGTAIPAFLFPNTCNRVTRESQQTKAAFGGPGAYKAAYGSAIASTAPTAKR